MQIKGHSLKVVLMRILVCIKQINNDGGMNRFDEFALEEALKIRDAASEQSGEQVTVDVVSAGGAKVCKVIRRAFGMGADKGFHVEIPDYAQQSGYVSPLTTALLLSVAASKMHYDLILTGIMSQDMMQGAVGPMLAGILGFPCVTGVVKIKLPYENHGLDNDFPKSRAKHENGLMSIPCHGRIPVGTEYANGFYITVEREMENRFVDCLKIRLPAVLTVQAGINVPRYPRLSNLLASKQKTIIVISGSDPSFQEIFPRKMKIKERYISMEKPGKVRESRVIDGALSDVVRQFIDFLQEKRLM